MQPHFEAPMNSCLFQRDKHNTGGGGRFFCKDCHPFFSKGGKIHHSSILNWEPTLSLQYFISICLNMREFSTFLWCLCCNIKILGVIVLQRKVSPQTLLWYGLRSHVGSKLPSFPWHVLSVNLLVFLFHFDNAHVRNCIDFFNHLSQPYY